MPRIVTVTLNPTVDLSSDTEVVRPVRKVRTRNERFDPGGGGINVARVIARLGGDVEAVYLAGGEIGALLDRLLADHGIARHRIAIAGQTRVGYIVHEQSTGLEYRFVPEGPHITAADCEACRAALASRQADYLVCSGSLPGGAPADTYVRIAEMAASKGAKFVLDSSGDGLRTTLETDAVYLVKPSLGELEQFVGRKLTPDQAAREASRIVERGMAELVAVTLGTDGAILAGRGVALRLPAIPVRVGSAVGAGDSFLAAMVWALSQGRAAAEAFRLGVAAGAAAAMTPGTELCRIEDVHALYERAFGG
ncbi:MAG: 1-phosphofructokinase family hexose kinase [Rhizobiaceae bacterium]|nr:MAG: 1-phosphofructokinase family hexose kinase [Rhizobiaceae bacterium]CAG1005404.1 6-phosphofructokinase 2 [Rhizobiaceae bacterium]